jgi:hypothetical protein
MPPHFFFYPALVFIILHEMDAVRCREWRIFPGLSLLPDKTGQLVFMLAHLPVFYWIFWKLFQQPLNDKFIAGMNIFFIFHLALHLLFLKHPRNEFKDWLSWTFIAGAAACGLTDLLVD